MGTKVVNWAEIVLLVSLTAAVWDANGSSDFEPEPSSLGDESVEHRGASEGSRQSKNEDVTFWQFKKIPEDGDGPSDTSGRASNEYTRQHQYPPPHPLPSRHGVPSHPYARDRIFMKPNPKLGSIFGKHRLFGGRGRPGPRRRPSPRPPHETSAPVFISYGPVYGPPPMQQQSQEWRQGPPSMQQWQQTSAPMQQWQTAGPSQAPAPQQQWQAEGPTYLPPTQEQWETERPTHATPPQQQWETKRPTYPPRGWSTQTPSAPPPPPVVQYGTPTQVTPAYWSQAPASWTNTHPPPTYGPPVRIPPLTSNKGWGPPTTRNPPRQQAPWAPPAQNQGPWNPLPPSQNQWQSPPTTRRTPVHTYIPPTYGAPTAPTSNYIPPRQAQGGEYATPSSNYIPPRQPGPTYGPPSTPASLYDAPVRSLEIQVPMHFGSPMHNFGPPHSSYGQPPPIIGDPPHDRYAPKEDIYRYPTGDNDYNPAHHSHRWESYQAAASKEKSYEVPSVDLYQTPRKPYKEPGKYKRMPASRYEDSFKDYSNNKSKSRPRKYEVSFKDYPNPNAKSYGQTEEGGFQGQDPNARPPPKYDTNYNSPGLSKNPKIVDWMPYSAKNYHELPSQKKKKAPKYRTLPTSLRNHEPDPEHDLYPKLTYDTISKRMALAETAPTPAPSPPRVRSKQSELQLKTEREFKEMLDTHAKLIAMR